MVKGVFKMMYTEVRGLHQAAYVLAVFAFASQLLALFRDRLLAHQFGAGASLDTYYAAFRIPDLLYVLFASTLSVYVLIPFVAARVNGEDSSQARHLLSQVYSVFLLVYILLAAIVWLFAPLFVPHVFPGVDPVGVVTLLRILLLQPLFLGISSLYGVVTQLGHRFVLYSISPLIYNVGIIGGILFLYPMFGMPGLGWGVVIGAAGHLLIQVPLVRQSALSFGLTWNISWADLKSILWISVPRASTLAMQQVVLLVFVSIASVMAVGSVAIFQFAYNLQSVPLAVIGSSYSIAAFPMLADLFVQRKMEAFRTHIITALRHIIFWSVPIVGLVIVLRAQMVRVVLGSGAFNWNDTRLTAAVLALLVISLFAQSINLLLIRTFYAGGYTRVPFTVTSISSAISIVIVLILYFTYPSMSGVMSLLTHLLRIVDVPGTEVILVALSYTIGSIIQTVLLLFFVSKSFAVPMDWIWSHFAKAVTASVVGGLFAYGTLNVFVGGINANSTLGILLQGVLGGIIGLMGVIVTYYLLGSEELMEIYRSLKGRFRKIEVVTTQDDILL